MTESSHLPTPRTISLTIVAMPAFAANSVLCRLALAHDSIDPASFTAVRIAGVIALWLILALTGKANRYQGSWRAALALFMYAATFSFACMTLSAGAGALLLFVCRCDQGVLPIDERVADASDEGNRTISTTLRSDCSIWRARWRN